MNAIVESRQKWLGGSDIPALLGIAPKTWKRNSPLSLWYDKQTPRVENPRERDNPLFRRGKRWESVVAEMLVEELKEQGHTVKILDSNHRYVDPVHPFFRAEIDYEVELDGEPDPWNVEIKTCSVFKSHEWGESETDGAPDYVIAQLLWGLGVTQRRRGIIAPLFGADTLRVFPFDNADQEVIGLLRAKGLKFWTEHVVPGVPPDPLFLADMGLLFPNEGTDPPLVADDELTGQVLRLRALQREIKAREAEYEALEFNIKRAMGPHHEIVLGDTSAVTWKTRKHSWLDQWGLKQAHPKIHREFMRTKPARVFTVKSFKWNGRGEENEYGESEG
jgi:predicted phage-related endonuclease